MTGLISAQVISEKGYSALVFRLLILLLLPFTTEIAKTILSMAGYQQGLHRKSKQNPHHPMIPYFPYSKSYSLIDLPYGTLSNCWNITQSLVHDIVHQVVYKFTYPTHVICLLGGHIELIKTLKELNLLYRLVIQILQLVQGSAKMAFFYMIWSRYWVSLIRYIIRQSCIQYIIITIAEVVFLCLF